MNSITELREVARDDSQPAQVRKEAAELLVQHIAEQAGAAPIQYDDPEVIKLMTPPPENTEVEQFIADLMRRCGYTVPTLAEAKQKVSVQRRLRAVLAVVVDEEASQIERLAACAWVLQEHPHFNSWKTNGYSPERLLGKVLPAGSLRYTSEGQMPVQRPPQSLRDVWG